MNILQQATQWTAEAWSRARHTLCLSLWNTGAMNRNGNMSQEEELRVMGSHDEMIWSTRVSGQPASPKEGTSKLTWRWIWNGGAARTQEENWAKEAVQTPNEREFISCPNSHITSEARVTRHLGDQGRKDRKKNHAWEVSWKPNSTLAFSLQHQVRFPRSLPGRICGHHITSWYPPCRPRHLPSPWVWRHWWMCHIFLYYVSQAIIMHSIH